eukprot:scaffold242195_cov24-Tisochrysis_lutea.AAC.2
MTHEPRGALAHESARSTSASPSHWTSRTPASMVEAASCSYMSAGSGSCSACTFVPSRHARWSASSRRCRSMFRFSTVSAFSRVAGPSRNTSGTRAAARRLLNAAWKQWSSAA